MSERCWDLLDQFLIRSGPRPVLVERDNDVPAYSELEAEVLRADTMLTKAFADAA